jgi:hypothetical protein
MNDLCIYPSRTTPPKGKGMQLGRKAKVNTFLDALATEQVSQVPTIDQEKLATAEAMVAAQVEKETTQSKVAREDVHVEVEEKIFASANRDGGLESMEVRGALILHVADTSKARIKLELAPSEDSEIQFKVGTSTV